jgi:hypothetical protein
MSAFGCLLAKKNWRSSPLTTADILDVHETAYQLVMNTSATSVVRSGVLLAINLLFLMVWGFAGIGKLLDGIPSWFDGKFGGTFMAKFPGLTATFWILALSELLAFALAAVALVSGEFLGRKPLRLLPVTLLWSLFVFLQLGFGQWLTGDFSGAFQQFVYFSGTLLSLQFATAPPGNQTQAAGPVDSSV